MEVKIVFLGASSVGKTCIVNYATTGEFNADEEPTVGAAYATKIIQAENQTEIKIQIWDTAGQEKFRSLAPMYYRHANAAVLIFAIDSVDSFNEIDSWMTELKSHLNPMPVTYIVGNKCDKENGRVIETTAGQAKAESYGAFYMETSALTGAGIEELFAHIGEQMTAISPNTETTTTLVNEYEVPGPEAKKTQDKCKC